MLSPEAIAHLDGLFTALAPSDQRSSTALTGPAICLAQLSSATSKAGVRWSVAVGAEAMGGRTLWWVKQFDLSQLEEAVTVKGSALGPQQIINRITQAWNAEQLKLSEMSNGALILAAKVQLTINLGPDLAIQVNLAKTDRPSIDHFRLHQKTIPLAQSSALASSQLAALQSTHTALEKRHAKLESELKALQAAGAKEERASLKRSKSSSSSRPFTARAGSQSGPSESPPSPRKKVARGLMPGDKGYSGNSRRIGRVVVDEGWDEDPPSSDG